MKLLGIPQTANDAASMLEPYRHEVGYLADALAALDWMECPTKAARKRAERFLRQAAYSLSGIGK